MRVYSCFYSWHVMCAPDGWYVELTERGFLQELGSDCGHMAARNAPMGKRMNGCLPQPQRTALPHTLCTHDHQPGLPSIAWSYTTSPVLMTQTCTGDVALLGLTRVTKLVQLALHALQLLWRIPSRHMATITAKFLQKSSLRQLHVPTSGCTHRMPAVEAAVERMISRLCHRHRPPKAAPRRAREPRAQYL